MSDALKFTGILGGVAALLYKAGLFRAAEAKKPEIITPVATLWSENTELAYGFTVADLSTKATYPHAIKAQKGLTESEIINNLKWVVKNIVEPLARKYGRENIIINSGFRVGDGKSQHFKGEAVDIQIIGFSKSDYFAAAHWIKNNLNFDQFILEYGNNKMPVYHISSKRTGNRGDVLTETAHQKYESGLIKYA
nr:hypothetical protein 14 [bacterium]